jgi:hypothetical protein
MFLPFTYCAGSLAEKVCLAGDSAGGNLCLGVTLHANQLGIRAPDAVMPVYPALAMVMELPSPSRVLSVMDPLISFGALVACFKVLAVVWIEVGVPKMYVGLKIRKDASQKV